MNKTISLIVILVFILGAGIALLKNVLNTVSQNEAATTTPIVSTTTPIVATTTVPVATTTNEKVNTPITKGRCYVGGCSGQICSDQVGMVSTCEYRESYACYKTAKCERQTNGSCGWTETPTLTQCLRSAN